MIWTAKEAAIVTNGKIFSNWHGGKIVFDSRLIEPGDIFLALPGNSSDGHAHVAKAFGKGAAAAIVEKIPEDVSKERLLLVKDSFIALNDLANYKRLKSKAKFIAITGSVGKTSTKELLALALAVHGKTFISRGNYNNFLGVPINLASMPDNTDYAVIEVGMDHAKEISPLTQMIRPNIAIITGVESIHRANFNSIEGIAAAKAEIFEGLEANGIAIINALSGCYDFLYQRALDNSNISKIITIGVDSKVINYLVENNKTEATLDICGDNISIKMDSILGVHQVFNMITTLTIVSILEQNIDKSAKALENFELPIGRGKVSKININSKSIILIDDSYNAGPVSVKAALKNISHYSGRKIVILGDMVDLGEGSLEMHLALKEDIIMNKIDKVICFGESMKHLHKSLPTQKQYGSYFTLKELAIDLPNKLKNGDILLIKGSFYLTRLYYFTQHLREGTLSAL